MPETKGVEVPQYIIGVPVLEHILGGIRPGSLIVILGHPGAGKTTFASKLIYENMKSLGVKAAYISLAERFEKYIDQMKSLGMDFEPLIASGQFRYIHLPTLPGTEPAEELARLVSSLIEEGFRIFVIDSITPILKGLEDAQARALLHSTLYDLANDYGALFVVIADLPWGEESINLGGLEFVADGLFIMKTRLEGELLIRSMEIRKFRGAAIPLAEIPFTIVEGMGVRFYPFLPPEEIPPLDSSSLVSTGCRLLDDAWGMIPAGASISILYPIGCNIPSTILGIIAKFIIENRLRVGLISFELSGDALLQAFKKTASLYGLDTRELHRLVALKRSFNPTSYSIYELMGNITSGIDTSKPNLLILHGLTSLLKVYGSRNFVKMLYNLWLYLRSLRITMIRFAETLFRGPHLLPFPEYEELAMFSDVVHIVVPKPEGYSSMLVHIIMKSIPRFVSESHNRDKPVMITDERLSHVCLGEYIAPY